MNKIKDSFSKIKASDEFKDKLLRELQVNPVKSKPNIKRIHYRPIIAAATILFIFIGIISYKFAMDMSEKGNSNLDSMAYAPETEESLDKNHTSESTESNSNIDISSKETEIAITSDTGESTITSKTNENTIPHKTELSTNKSTVNEKTNSDNIVTSSSNDISNDNKNIDSNNDISKNIKPFNSNSSVNSLYIPKIQLPKSNTLTTAKMMTLTAKMMPLIVYEGNVYIYTPIEISSENAKNLLGRKLGTTKGNINEWSTQSDHSNEFASNIGVTDVYAVNGYDESFRIMTNITTEDGKNHPEFYECLNGITIKNGADIFGKLKLQGNITNAKFQTFSDWNNGTGIFYTINDFDLLNSLLDQINKATPYLPEDIEPSLGDYRNKDTCKEVSLDLKDGSQNLTFTILKSGYVYYGYPRIYLKINDKFTEELWNKLSIMQIN